MKSIYEYNKVKKGIALNQAFGAVLTVVLIGVLVIIAIFLFVNLGSSLNTQAASVTNQTLAVSGATTVNTTACGLNSLGSFTAYNATGGELIPANNYTITGGGELTPVATSEYDGFDWNLTYGYLQGGDACTANNTMITQFATYPVLVGLIGTIVFLGLVIGVLVASFVFNGKRGV